MFSRHYSGCPHTYIIAVTTQGSLPDNFYFFSVFSPLHALLSSVFQMKLQFNTISGLDAADQSRMSDCLVAFGRYLPSAAMRSGILRIGLPLQWQSNSWSIFTEVSTFLEYTLISARQNSSTLPPVAPFVGPDNVLSPLRWMSTHIIARTTQGGLADDFYLLLSQTVTLKLFFPPSISLARELFVMIISSIYDCTITI